MGKHISVLVVSVELKMIPSISALVLVGIVGTKVLDTKMEKNRKIMPLCGHFFLKISNL